MITEVGGTVGDIESLPFLEAIRQVRHDVGRDNCFFLHVSLVPYLAPSGELKTKPTQHSVAALRYIGIQPDAMVCRSDREIPANAQAQALADVRRRRRGGGRRPPDAPSIYDIPKVLHAEGLDAYVVRRLGLPFRDVDWTAGTTCWTGCTVPADGHGGAGRQVRRPAGRVPVGDRGAAGRRVRQRLPGGDPLGALRRLPDPAGAAAALSGWTVCSCPAASASAASRARSARSGTPASTASRPSACASACSAWSSRWPGTWPASTAPTRRSSTETTPHPVIATMADQQDVVAGAGRHGRHDAAGAYPAGARPGSLVAEAYGADRGHRAAPAPVRGEQRLPRQLAEAGLVFSGTSPDGRLVEFVELPRDVHPFFVATQAHPELKSPARPGAPAVRRRSSGGAGPTPRPSGCRSRCRSGTPRAPSRDRLRRRVVPREPADLPVTRSWGCGLD